MFEPTPRPPPVKGGRDRARRRVRGTRPHLSSPIAKQWREGDRREAAVEGAFSRALTEGARQSQPGAVRRYRYSLELSFALSLSAFAGSSAHQPSSFSHFSITICGIEATRRSSRDGE